MPTRKDTISQGIVQILPLIYTVLNQESIQKGVAKQAELTHLQSHILETLFQLPEGTSISELARSNYISKQQMTPIIQKLEENGYIEKIRDLTDKRSFKVKLATAGREIITRKWEELYHHFSQQLEKLNEDEQIDLEYALYKLKNILEKLHKG